MAGREGMFSVIKSNRFVRKRQTVKLTADTDPTNDVPGKLVGALVVLTHGGLLGISVICIALGGQWLVGLAACSAVTALSWVSTPRSGLSTWQLGTAQTGRGIWGGW